MIQLIAFVEYDDIGTCIGTQFDLQIWDPDGDHGWTIFEGEWYEKENELHKFTVMNMTTFVDEPCRQLTWFLLCVCDFNNYFFHSKLDYKKWISLHNDIILVWSVCSA